MPTVEGQKMVSKSPDVVLDRLNLALAAASCHVEEQSGDQIKFSHGSYRSQGVQQLPKSGSIRITSGDAGTVIHWSIAARPFITGWLIVIATVFCWVIFPPFLVYRALKVEPRKFMENMLAGI